MKFVSSFAIAAALVAGGLAATPAAAQKKGAAAQKKGKAETAQPAARKYNFSKEAQKPIQELNAAVTAKNNDEFATRLAAAEAVAKNADEKYVVAKLRLQHAINLDDPAAQLAAIQAILASGGADSVETASLNKNLGIIAANKGDFAAAETAFAPLVAADPNNLELVVSLARAKLELKKDAEASELLQRAITITKAAGKQADEAWYRKVLEIAHNQNNKPLALQMARETLTLYPSEVNLKNAIIVYQGVAALDKEGDLDLLRLMRASKTMTGPGGYLALAETLNDAGLVGEAKAVIEEGRRLGIIKGNGGAQLLSVVSGRIAEDRASLAGVDSKARTAANGSLAMKTAAAYFGYGDYAKAVELYRVALQKGGVDSNIVNTRLGIALALAGQKAEAAAAFQAVTGPRADLAKLWLAWVNQRA